MPKSGLSLFVVYTEVFPNYFDVRIYLLKLFDGVVLIAGPGPHGDGGGLTSILRDSSRQQRR